jgi:hypothetical protein
VAAVIELGHAATAAVRASPRDHLVVLGLGTAAAYASLAQGAYYGRQAVTVLLLVAVAAVARVAVRGRPVPPTVTVAAACWVLFGLWAVVSGQLAGDAAAALPTAAVASCLAAAAVAVAGLPDESRRVLLGVLLAVAVVVAASSWVGVALHLEPLALPSSGLWRGASTLTYANATSAFLVIALVLAVAVGPVRHRLAEDGLVAVLLLGLLVTMSRAGALGLLVAVAVHLALARDPSRLRRHAAVLPAVAVASAGLLPSLPVGSPPHPLLALAGVAAGFGVVVAARHVRLRHLVVVAVGAVVLLLAVPAVADAMRGIVTTRLTTASAERADLARVTAEQFWSAPLTGVGPGQLDLRYVDHAGRPVRAVHTHDEYLQTAAETGVVGLGLAVAGLAALAAGALRSRTRESAAAAAIVTAFAVHSAFDFLWHVPVLPLLLILTVVPLTTAVFHPIERSSREHETQDHHRGRSGAGAQRRTRLVGRRGERPALEPDHGRRAAEPAGG